MIPTTQVVGAVTQQEEDEMIAKSMEILIRRVSEYKQRAEIAENKLIEQQPKIEFFNTVTESEKDFLMSDVAKMLNLGYGDKTLYKKLRELKILDSRNVPYQQFMNRGYFNVCETIKKDSYGNQRIFRVTRTTNKGMDYIRKTLVQDNN